MDEPRYKHDCESCVFLGQRDAHDLYFCDCVHPTVLARYSDRGEDYTSGLPLVGIAPPLTEAAKRAVARGLLDQNTKTGNINGRTIAEAILASAEQDV